jgi:hypothetical protein
MYKFDKISNPILIDKGSIWGKEIQIWIGKDSIRILEGLINFIEDLVARRIDI